MSWLRPEHSRNSSGGGGSSGGGSSKPAPVDYAAQFQGLLNAPSLASFQGLLSQYFPQYAGMLGGQTPAPQPGQAGSMMAPAWGATAGDVTGWMNSLPTSAPPLSTASSAFQSAYPTITKDLYATPKKK